MNAIDVKDPRMIELFFQAVRTEQTILMLGSNQSGFNIYPNKSPPPEFVALAHEHSDRLRALLDKPVILAVHWRAGDRDAIVQIMPVKLTDPTARFSEFALPFPAA